MARNAFKTNMVWWNLYTFSNKKCRHKKLFSTKPMIQQLFSEPSTLFDNGSLPPCWSKQLIRLANKNLVLFLVLHCWAGILIIKLNNNLRPLWIILKGILFRNEKMSCRHTKSPFYTLRRLKHIFWKEWVRLSVTSFTAFSILLHNQ